MASESESEKRETLADIVAEMRRGTKLPGFWRSCDLNKILKYHADRIEAAAKLEMTEAEANALAVGGLVEAERQREVVSKTETTTVGNAAAMRDALVELTDKVLDYLHKGLIQLPLPLENAIAKANAALSAPARQCDVGTAEEQRERFERFCLHEFCNKKCPCYGRGDRCELLWAQTPYAAQEGAGK